MTDSKPKKTLVLKKTVRPADDTDTRPKRSGARARQAVNLERQREQQERMRQHEQRAAPQSQSESEPQPYSRSQSQPNSRSQSRAKSQLPDRSQSKPQDGRQQPQHAGSDSPRHRSSQRTAKHAGGRDLTTVYAIFASCPQGLEEALAAELQALGYDHVKVGRAGCHFVATWTGIMRANLYSRLAARVLVQLAKAPVRTEDDILELAQNTPWEHWFGPEHTLRVDTSAVRSPMQSLQFCNLRVKDGICDRLRDKEGDRPSIDTVRPDARVHLFLDQDSATLYLDSTGEALFKRGWRLDKGAAPLRENLAAGILALAGWDPAAPLLDPFCGSGTILIEAAWIALGIPPGIARPFGFERLRDHNHNLWLDIKNDARTHIATELPSPLLGYDLDSAALQAAQQNVKRARIAPGLIRFEKADARTVLPPDTPEAGWVVTNPPYGERLDDSDDSLWPDFASNLKQNYDGWNVNIISSDMDLPRALRLKPLRRHPLYNGALDCRLFSFEMVAAGYREPRQ